MQLLRRISFTMLLMSLMTLVACGGGDLTGGTGPEPAGTLTITKSEGDLSAANDVTITATLSESGSPVSNMIITFNVTNPELATLSPSIGTAVTDENGNASILVKVTDVAGGVEVSASFSDVKVYTAFTSLGDGDVPPPVGGPVAASISLFASSQQIASSGAQSVLLSAIAKDVNNNLVKGVTINFSADSGALEGILDDDGESSNVTGPDGKVSMLLSTQSEPTNRIITATVTSGDITDSLEISVVGTSLTLTGTTSLSLNDEATYILNVLDSDGNGVAKTDVLIALSGRSIETPAGAVASITIPAMVTTDADGQATIKATGTSGGSNSIIVTALGASAEQDVSVQSDSFLFTSFSNGVDTVNPSITPVIPDVSLTQVASLTLTWKRNGALIPDGTSVSLTTTRGVLSTNSTTTAGGMVTATLTSSDAGPALVTLVGKDTVSGKEIELTNQLQFDFFADAPATIKAQASPNSIGPNQQTSTISVVVKDVDGNLVKNQKIKFILEDISGGSIFPATAITDSSGSASTIYTSNSTSAKDAVSITAVVEDNTSITDTVSLTVSGRELFISLGTGNEIEELGTTDYVKEYSVFVTDAESNAVENVDLTISAIPHKYYKGYYYPLYDGDKFLQWIPRGADALEQSVGFTPPLTSANLPKFACDNEDENFNGILDAGEDFNTDNLLTPGNVVSAQGSVTTDADGRAVIRIVYPQSYGYWLDVNLIASTKVTGSESIAQTIFNLPVLADDVNKEDNTPPVSGVGLRGPFGLLNDCSKNISEDPKLDGT